MWIPRRSQSGRGELLRSCGGFTLIELLVVVAIIALLMSILLPSLSAAREQGRMAVCGQHQRQFGNALLVYTTENEDWLPGLNTSGVNLESKRFQWGQHIGVIHDAKMPVQRFDWMTPLLAQTTELPDQRAARFKFLLEEFRCPSQFYPSVLYRDGFAGPDWNDFVDLAPWPAVSYLMPVHFQYYGQNYRSKILGTYDFGAMNVNIKAEAAPTTWEVRVDEYIPKLSRVGSAARKVFIADGTRYLPTSLLLDHDVSISASIFGSFTSSGAYWGGSTAYGVQSGTPNWDGGTVQHGGNYPPAKGRALALSYRHGRQDDVTGPSAMDNSGMMLAAFFDGHVERMSDKQSRDAHLWYPSGGIVQHPEEGMRTVPPDFVIP